MIKEAKFGFLRGFLNPETVPDAFRAVFFHREGQGTQFALYIEGGVLQLVSDGGYLIESGPKRDVGTKGDTARIELTFAIDIDAFNETAALSIKGFVPVTELFLERLSVFKDIEG